MEQPNEDIQNIKMNLKDLREATDKETKKETLKSLVKYNKDLFSPQDIELVAKLLLDGAPSVRARAAAVLGHCKSHIHLDALITLTKDKYDNVAQAAALALGEIGDPRAIDAIKDVLTRLESCVDHARDRKSRQRLIEPRIYPSDPARITLTFIWRDRLGHDKAEARADRAISEASGRMESVRQALQKCSNPVPQDYVAPTQIEHRRKPPLEQRNQLSLEGTRFPLFSEEDSFFEECRKSGQAALVLQFAEFWSVRRRGYEVKAIGGGTRLLCSSCLLDMAMSFQMSLLGGMMGDGMIAIGEGLPSNLFDAAKSAKCPFCGSDTGILLLDYPDYGNITDHDMEALRELWHFRCQLWWNQNDRSEGICDRCSTNRISRGEGYHRSSEVICEECAVNDTDSEALSSLRENPDYFGTSELRRARNFKAGRWRFERGSIQAT